MARSTEMPAALARRQGTTLRETFGLARLRPGQRAVINRVRITSPRSPNQAHRNRPMMRRASPAAIS
jgi:hypothetical protein